MPICRGKTYLLAESSETHSTPMDPQLAVMLADIKAKLDNLILTYKTQPKTEKRCSTSEQPTNKQPLLQPYTRRNPHTNALDPNEQYLNTIKLDVLAFDGHLDPQLFLDWPKDMNRYFTGYPLFEFRKIRFTAIKLAGQASQYWTNVETLQASRAQ